MTGVLSELVLCGSYVDHAKPCEFMGLIDMPSPEDNNSKHASHPLAITCFLHSFPEYYFLGFSHSFLNVTVEELGKGKKINSTL